MSGKSRFNRPKRRFEVSFDDHEDETLHGLVVTFQGMSTGEMLDLMDLSAGSKGDTAAAKAAMVSMLERLAAGIVWWNYCEGELDDVAPVAVETLRRMEPDLLFILVDQWQAAIAGVSAPLDQRSNGGAPFLAELPTTALS